MANIRRIQDAVSEFCISFSEAVRTIQGGIDIIAIAIERLEDEVSLFEAEKPRAAKKCAAKKSATKTKGKK